MSADLEVHDPPVAIATSKPPRRRLQAVFVALAMLASVLSIWLGTAGAASATASGCTTASVGDVCTTVNGSGTNVVNVYVVRNKASWSGICYYTGQVTASYGGSRWVVGTQSYNGCTYGRAWFTIPVNHTYWSGTVICGSFYEYGQIQGTACDTVHN